MKPSPAELRRIKQGVYDAATGRPTLSTFLDRLHGLHPDLDAATEGIYTGREGRISEPIGEWGRVLVFGWYSTEGRKYVVEYAYIS
jgi:hypothetical protein